MKCIVQSKSLFLEGSINITFLEEICHVYDTLFKLNMSFDKSLNSGSNIILQNLPIINYGPHIIRRGEIYTFLKEITNIDSNINYNQMELIEMERLEHLILFDLQLAVNCYFYYHNSKKKYFVWNFLKFIYQPFRFMKTYLYDKNMIEEIHKHLGISSKVEVNKYFK
jgi:hypothetical protein